MKKADRKLLVFSVMDALQRMPDMPGDYIRGANSPKSKFIDHGKRLLRIMAKDLGLTESKVKHNAGGPGVCGEVSLAGFLPSGRELSVVITGFTFDGNNVLYRLDGYPNRWMAIEKFHNDWHTALDNLTNY